METSLFLAQLIGLTLIIAGLAVLVRQKPLTKAMSAAVKDTMFLFYSGIEGVVVGLALILNHNIWQGESYQIVLTVLSWYVLLKGIVLLFAPQKFFSKLMKKFRSGPWVTIDALVIIALGAYLASWGFGLI